MATDLESASWKQLETWPVERLERLCHDTIIEICGWKEQQNNNSNNGETKELRRNLKTIYSDAVKNNWNESKFVEMIPNVGPDVLCIIHRCYSVRKDEIEMTKKMDLLKLSGNALVDFDWNLKMAMGSDKIAVLKEMFLHLHLHIQNDSSGMLYLELNKQQLQMLINSLESCQKAAVQLKV